MKTKRTPLALTALALFTGCAAHANPARETWADVVAAVPVTETIHIPQEREVCRDEQVYYPVQQYRSATPLIFGALLGGVIGNQFGGGHGQDLMTVAGAALGTSIAADQQARRHPAGYTVGTERRCQVETDWRTEERVVAWDVTWVYLGEEYTTRMDEHPGEQVRVRVQVDPVH